MQQRDCYCTLETLHSNIRQRAHLTETNVGNHLLTSPESRERERVKVIKLLINSHACGLQVGQNSEANTNCRSCGKVVFQMEQTKAEGLVWHKNCFRCVQCSKQLNVDNYESHESTLYCKPHFKELFQPKPVEESDQPGKMITVARNTAARGR